jgi:hypothetical protein
VVEKKKGILIKRGLEELVVLLANSLNEKESLRTNERKIVAII